MALHIIKSAPVVVTGSINRLYADSEVLDLSGDLDQAVAACMDGAEIYKSANLTRILWNTEVRHAAQCVYVIGPVDPGIDIHKIGFGHSPSARLTAIQVGNWHRLEVKALLWVYGGANKIEQTALRAAGEMDLRLGGEWVDMSARDATELALKAARYEKADVSDSAAYLRNLGSRAEAVAKTKMLRYAA